MKLVSSLRPMIICAPVLGLGFCLTFGAAPALAQKGGTGGGGGLNQTTATLLSAAPLLSAGIGSSTVVSLTISDSGSAPLSIAAVTLSGAAAGDYGLAGTCTSGAVLQRATTCVIQVTFAPTVVGQRNAVLTATFLNAPTISTPVNGVGRLPGPVFTISAPATGIDFGSKIVGSLPSGFTSDTIVGIANPGAGGLLGTMTFVGPNAGDFSFGTAGSRTFNCPANLQLGPPPVNNACQLGINFLPMAVGVRAATLHFTTNDPANPVFDLPLTGTGTLAAPPPPPPPPLIVSLADMTDLWGTATEPAWSLSITHHKSTTDLLVAFWQTYDVNGVATWFELKDGHWVDSLTFTATVHQPLGPPFAAPYDPALVSDVVVGTATLSFSDVSNGTFTYTVNGVSASKVITRTPF